VVSINNCLLSVMPAAS